MIGAIIQARMNSSRLPGKILKELRNKSILEHILYRLSQLQNKVYPVIATTVNPLDDQVEVFCSKQRIELFRGSEDNVLERYFHCAKYYGFTHIMRLTGDNPFIDSVELDNLVELHLSEHADYSSCVEGLPVGVGGEIFTFSALETSYKRSTSPHHFEHVNEYILENMHEFKTVALNILASKRSTVRLTVDTEEDFKRAEFVVNNACTDPVLTTDAILLAELFGSK